MLQRTFKTSQAQGVKFSDHNNFYGVSENHECILYISTTVKIYWKRDTKHVWYWINELQY